MKSSRTYRRKQVVFFGSVKRYHQRKSVENAFRTGRPRKITDRIDRLIVQHALKKQKDAFEGHSLISYVNEGLNLFDTYFFTHRSSSPTFLPRNAMHERGLCRYAVCVCARACVTFVNSVETSNRMVRLFHHRVDPSFQFFHTKRDGNTLTGPPPPNAGVECKGGMKKSRFLTQMVQDRAIVTMESEQETVLKLSTGTNYQFE